MSKINIISLNTTEKYFREVEKFAKTDPSVSTVAFVRSISSSD
jgi:hypothetical protein